MPKHNQIFNAHDSLLHSLLTPDQVINRIDTLQIGDEYHAFIGAMGYPGVLSRNWLSSIVDTTDGGNLNFSQFITPIDREKAQTKLQRHINELETEMALNTLDGKITPQTTVSKLHSARERMITLTGGTENAFDIANYFSVHDTSLPNLDRAIASLISTIKGLQIVPSRLHLRGWGGHRCMMPIGVDDIGMIRAMDSTATCRSLLLPGRARINSGEGGSIIGTEFDSGLPIVFNRFARSMNNANMLVLAQSGAGKTYSMSLDIMHQIEMGNDVVIFDTKPDYLKVVEDLGGLNVTIKAGSETCLNPFTIGTGPSDTLTSRKQELPTFIGLLVGGVSEAAKSGLMTCINHMYTAHGIIEKDPETWKISPPIMKDLYNTIVLYIDGKIKTDIKIQHSDIVSATTLAKDLYPYASDEGLYSSFFNGQTNLDLSGKLTNYDISGVPVEIRDAIMYLLLANTYEYMQQRHRGHRSVYLEEAWALLASNSEYIKRIIKLCRGFNMSLVIITQDLADVVGSSAGDAIIGNTATKIVLKIDNAFASQVGELVGLTVAEAATLPKADKGEGYLIVGGIATRFRTPSAPAEKKLIEGGSNANTVSERFNATQDFYVRKDMSPQQLHTLEHLKFRRVPSNRLGRGTADYMLGKVATNQSDDHFIMTHLIAAAANDLGMKSEINDYGKEFDVVIRNEYGFIIGFEVETGNNNWSDVVAKADRLNEPSERLKAKEWYFVVPSNMTKKYGEVHDNTITGGQIKSLLSNFAKMKPDIDVETDD